MTDVQVADLVAYLAEATTDRHVEIDPVVVAQARAEQKTILKPPRD